MCRAWVTIYAMIGQLKTSLLFTLVLWTVVSIAVQNKPKPTGTNFCISKQSCHECIQTPSCAWCSLPDFDDKRCFLPHINTRISEICPENYTFNPDNEYIKIRHKDLWKGSYSIDGGSESGFFIEEGGHESYNGKFNVQGGGKSYFGGKQEAVQLYPQEINLKLRINEVQKIKIEYAQAEDYPVDLYYLMDLSNSMKDDKQKLSDLGQLLVESMNNITSNFRLGFGSFVDKVIMPYVSMVPRQLEEPCDGCAAPYGFQNHMPLSQNTQKFAQEVHDAPVSGNLDAPEGGFDAIMQAIVCRDEIQWREKARKLLLFSTDAGFHFAGDGKLGGIVKPNDGCCHLDEYGNYKHSTLQDYPSISQINLKVKENSINIIWAVTEEQIKVYQSLTKLIEGSYAAKLSNDSSNIVDLVREQYNAISSTVEMKDTSSNYVNIKYFSSCLGGGPSIETNKCNGIKVGNKVEFTAEIVVPACPENRSEWNQKFLIYPIGINESLTVNLEMICDCQCEKPFETGYEKNSTVCHHGGDLSCGVCNCYDKHFGKNCECTTNDPSQTFVNEFACRRDNTSTVDCSGRGTCTCNRCECETRIDETEIIDGQYCECDNFSCDRRNNTICSGHGNCNCGVCNCLPGWSGDACECSTDTSACFRHGIECSGHGVCECGKCKCNVEGEYRYSGQYCQICRTCPSRCEELKPCVLCHAFKAGNLTETECNATCPDFHPVIVQTLEVDADEEETGCWGYDEHDCKYYFAYHYNMTTNKLQVRVQEHRECPPQVYILGIVLGVIGAVVLIGMALLLVWKLLTTIHDRREFARFEKERMMAKWDASENPIYKQATSTFKNPTYAASGAVLNKPKLVDAPLAPVAPPEEEVVVRKVLVSKSIQQHSTSTSHNPGGYAELDSSGAISYAHQRSGSSYEHSAGGGYGYDGDGGGAGGSSYAQKSGYMAVSQTDGGSISGEGYGHQRGASGYSRQVASSSNNQGSLASASANGSGYAQRTGYMAVSQSDSGYGPANGYSQKASGYNSHSSAGEYNNQHSRGYGDSARRQVIGGDYGGLEEDTVTIRQTTYTERHDNY
ncbi:integrin beta-PS-like isoform X1 [Trichogramma pretiosum]|uniref:integrin beta-PS-like isoform X1 n=2 Tax=Trichogramma pretiosum TaxID=7493 RepID=UPI0006C98023|nr:integrin beta-PS-like isoform X1 [Trichogramma pretiosum]